MTLLMVVAGFIAACIIVSLALYGGFCVLVKLEAFANRKFAEEALSDWTDPDGGLAAANDVERLHFSANGTGAQRDHA